MAAVAKEEVRRFITECLKAVGAPAQAALDQADLLVQADRTGHFSHGLNRLEFYINDILSGACEPQNKPTVLKESAATAWVDGKNALGATVGHFCMNLAIKKAKEAGVGWVTVKGLSVELCTVYHDHYGWDVTITLNVLKGRNNGVTV